LSHLTILIRDDYLWGATVLSSRSFPSRLITGDLTVEAETGPESALSNPILIPVMDMLNHRPNHPVTWLTSTTKITFVAETEYPANKEIFNNYGAKGNEECTPPSVLTNSVLMGYGFCLKDNPHDTVSLKLPNDSTVYSITRNNPVPEELLSKFTNATKNERERTLQRTTRRNLYEGRYALLQAVRSKLGGILEPVSTGSPAGYEANLYRDGQRSLLLAAHTRISQLMDDVVSDGGCYSWKTRQQKSDDGRPSKKMKLRKSEYCMVEWLASLIPSLEREGHCDLDDEKLKIYLKDLIPFYCSAVRKGEIKPREDTESITESRRITKHLIKEGIEVSKEDITVARTIWEEESVDIVKYADLTHAYNSSCSLMGSLSTSPALFRREYEKAVHDVGLLKDEIPLSA
jgi:hypothetical protein